MARTFAPKEFLDYLAHPERSMLALTGAAKRSEGDSESIEFSFAPLGEDWVRIPNALIDQVEEIGKVQCADSEHQTVRLTLKRPTDEAGRVFCDLLGMAVAGSLPASSVSSGQNEPADANVLEAWPHLPRLPPVRLPDQRAALRRRAEDMARSAAVRIAASSNRSNCKTNVRNGLLALGAIVAATSDLSGKYMGLVIAGMGYLADGACPE
jgi:hypothetical protein